MTGRDRRTKSTNGGITTVVACHHMALAPSPAPPSTSSRITTPRAAIDASAPVATGPITPTLFLSHHLELSLFLQAGGNDTRVRSGQGDNAATRKTTTSTGDPDRHRIIRYARCAVTVHTCPLLDVYSK